MSKFKRSFRPLVEQLECRLVPTDDPSLVPPVLNSLPGAAATLYLDFNGHFDAQWGSNSNVDTPPFDTDGNVNTWSANEIQQITQIWTHAAEDYAPFNINVSTVKPASFAPLVAQRVAIGGDGAWSGTGAFAISHLNSFNSGAGDDTCYVFPDTISAAGFVDEIRAFAFGVMHESGHTFGLLHQSDYDSAGNLSAEYSVGLTDGTSPNMGGNPDPERNMWWYGHNDVSVNTFQDDVAVISGSKNAFGYRADEAGNTAATAAPLNGVVTNNPNGTVTVNVAKKGVLAQMTDVDLYSFNAIPGPVSFKVDVPDPYNNLDVKVELRNSSGVVLASDDPSGSFDASVSFNIPTAGTYYLAVASHGISAAATANNYGNDIGGYEVDGSYIAPAGGQQGGGILRLYGAVRWRYQRRTNSYTAIVTLMPTADVTGPFTISMKLPHASIQWITPTGVRSGRNVKLTFNNDLTANTPFRFTVQVKNPLHVNLGTFFVGLKIVI
jgi:hypothetical protein